MKNKERITATIAELSKLAPSLRICQLISNAVTMKFPQAGNDLYNLTDEKLEEALEAYRVTLIEMDK